MQRLPLISPNTAMQRRVAQIITLLVLFHYQCASIKFNEAVYHAPFNVLWSFVGLAVMGLKIAKLTLMSLPDLSVPMTVSIRIKSFTIITTTTTQILLQYVSQILW